MRGNQKQTSRKSSNRNQYCMSEILALAVEAFVLLRHKAVNGCLLKFPGLHCEPVPHVQLNVVVRDESSAPQVLLGDQKWRNRRVRCLDCMEGDQEPPTEFLQECHDCVGRMRPCIIVEHNDPMDELAWSFWFDYTAKCGQGLRVMLGIHCCPVLQEVYLDQRRMSA